MVTAGCRSHRSRPWATFLLLVLASSLLTCTHCGDGTLLANDVLLQPLLQRKAASLLSLTLPLLLLVLQERMRVAQRCWAQEGP